MIEGKNCGKRDTSASVTPERQLTVSYSFSCLDKFTSSDEQRKVLLDGKGGPSVILIQRAARGHVLHGHCELHFGASLLRVIKAIPPLDLNGFMGS